jgi:hypothetical protein
MYMFAKCKSFGKLCSVTLKITDGLEIRNNNQETFLVSSH